VDRGGLVDPGGLLQQCKLPIGDLGELSDGVRQRCGERRKPLAGPPAIPDVVAEQIGASRHGRVTSIALADLLLDQDGLLDGGEVPHRSRREHRRRGRLLEFGRSSLEEGHHVGEELLRAVALRKADIAVRKTAVCVTFQVPPPFTEPGLRQRAKPGGAALSLPLGQHAEPYPNRSAWAAAGCKLAGWSNLEEIRGKPMNKIGRRVPPAAGLALVRGGAAADYFMDYIEGYTLRHLHTHASRKRSFSGVSREEKVADRI
jgi:hypothetical protein